MTPTPWIEWSKQAPKESDLPIQCANFGEMYAYHWTRLPNRRGDSKFDLWRPYVCDIPKSPDKGIKVSNMSNISVEDRLMVLEKWMTRIIQDCKLNDPQPDANGWWRIEDKEPEHDQEIKFERKGDTHTYIGIVERFRVVEAVRLRLLVQLDDITKWCPLDMTGPEEK